MHPRIPCVALLSTVVALSACAKDPDYENGPVDAGPPVWPKGFHVAGNQILDDQDKAVVLRGVNRSGTEYKCVQGGGIFDGPSSEASVAAITTWPGVNAVRVPLNESCWLGINGAAAAEPYKTAIKNYVNALHKHKLIPILELHWVGPGAHLANGQTAMPDADHALAFWTDMAQTFLADDGVVFEPFNEPYPDCNRDSDAGWACWRDGCRIEPVACNPSSTSPSYMAAGFQSIVDAIRATGSKHVILLGGLQYSNALSQWMAHAPVDPSGNLGAAWHLYNFNACVNAGCWDGAPAAIATAVPLVATEIGEDDCGDAFIAPLMQWLDGHGAGYLAWSWNAGGACVPAPMPGRGGKPWSLIVDYASGNPNSVFAQSFRDHVASRN